MDMGGKAEDEAIKAQRKSIEVWMLTTFQGQKMVLLLHVPPSVGGDQKGSGNLLREGYARGKLQRKPVCEK